ncbi:MAG: TetR/AcrR family transcriptional regulator [Marmoricola sp.]
MGAPARSYGGRSALERTEERRQRLVEAAITVLAAQGDRSTMTAICQEAGLTERYFYESFANRDAALVAALDHVSDEIATDAVRVLQETDGPVQDRVLAMTRAFAEWASTRPERAIVAVVQSSATGPLRARRHELIRVFADLAAREAAELYGEGAWPADRARVQGIVFIGGLAELVASWLSGEADLDTDQLAGVVADLFVSLGRRTPGQA